MTETADTVRASTRIVDDRLCVVHLAGVLNSHTYREVRDAVIKAALDHPDAVIVDVSDLAVPAQSAWAVFTSARWHVRTWPDVPILLVHSDGSIRQTIASNGVARYVPVLDSTEAAIEAARTGEIPQRRRYRAQLGTAPASLAHGRILVQEWLTHGPHTDLIAAAAAVVTVLVENVLAHTESAPTITVETTAETVTITVEDSSSRAPCLREDPMQGADPVAGLSIIASLSRAWGSTPTATGKVVWAVLGRENAL